jgi:hypothetical protein
MTHGIDWDAIERARTARASESVIPDGYFRARDYAQRCSITVDAASSRLTRLMHRGVIEREKFGAEYGYRIKT